MVLTPLALAPDLLADLAAAAREGRLYLVVVPAGVESVTVTPAAPRPLDPLDQIILNAVRGIIARTHRPARTEAVTVQVECDTGLNLSADAIRRRLYRLEAEDRVYRLSPKGGWLLQISA